MALRETESSTKLPAVESTLLSEGLSQHGASVGLTPGRSLVAGDRIPSASADRAVPRRTDPTEVVDVSANLGEQRERDWHSNTAKLVGANWQRLKPVTREEDMDRRLPSLG